MNQNILVVAAHPDDEVLGCGGAIARHADSGDRVHVLIIAEGATSRQVHRNRIQASDQLSDLYKSAHSASRILGVEKLEMFDFPDNRLDSVDRLELIKLIENKIFDYTPDTVYLHHSGDVNIDHRRLHEAVVTACRPVPHHPVKRLLSFEIPSSTEWQPPFSAQTFMPNTYIDVSAQLERKRAALEAYSSEMRPWPHARSIDAVIHLAHLRGSQIGYTAAESFCLLRDIVA